MPRSVSFAIRLRLLVASNRFVQYHSEPAGDECHDQSSITQSREHLYDRLRTREYINTLVCGGYIKCFIITFIYLFQKFPQKRSEKFDVNWHEKNKTFSLITGLIYAVSQEDDEKEYNKKHKTGKQMMQQCSWLYFKETNRERCLLE